MDTKQEVAEITDRLTKAAYQAGLDGRALPTSPAHRFDVWSLPEVTEAHARGLIAPRKS